MKEHKITHKQLKLGIPPFEYSDLYSPNKLKNFQNLNSRLKVNSVLEKLSNKWLDYLLRKKPIEAV